MKNKSKKKVIKQNKKQKIQPCTPKLNLRENLQLDPTQFQRWTREQVCSLLCTEENSGGASLTVEDVKPLYDAGFKGSSISNIVFYLRQGINNAYNNIEKDYPQIARATLNYVVHWVTVITTYKSVLNIPLLTFYITPFI